MLKMVFGKCVLVVALVSFFALPHSAHANVVISEFMYDVSGSDSGAEWVELFNAGASAVDLATWKINDGSNHVLNDPPKNGGIGSLVIAPGAYIILADDATVFEGVYPSVANVIDTVLSLPNTSGTVSLIDESGTTVDSISYTKDQGAAGDGNSLSRSETSSATLSAGAPTPGVGSLPASSAGDSDQDQHTNATTNPDPQQKTQTHSNAPVSSYVPPPAPTLFVDAGSDRAVIVGADTEFNGRAYDRDQKSISEHVRFSWNFGDGTTAEGQSVLHHFSYPGRYAVFLHIAQNRDATSDEVIVTAEPAKLAFTAFVDGSVSIENGAGRDLDLSGWIVKHYGDQFVLPEHSVILTGQSMRIAPGALGFRGSDATELDYPNGVLALRAGEHSATTDPPALPVAPNTEAALAPAPAARLVVAIPSEQTSSAPENPELPVESATGDDALTLTAPPQVAGVAGVIPDLSRSWWIIALFLILAACGALVAARRAGKHEWDIVEEKG